MTSCPGARSTPKLTSHWGDLLESLCGPAAGQAGSVAQSVGSNGRRAGGIDAPPDGLGCPVCQKRNKIKGRGRRIMVIPKLPKLEPWVRFPSPAPPFRRLLATPRNISWPTVVGPQSLLSARCGRSRVEIYFALAETDVLHYYAEELQNRGPAECKGFYATWLQRSSFCSVRS